MDDILVVGGGLAGLATAAWCARAGAAVSMLERARTTGGRARTEMKGGFSLNHGAHALYAGCELGQAMAELGVVWKGKKPPAQGALAIANGELFALPTGLMSIVATDLLGFGAKVEAARALVAVGRTDTGALRGTTWDSWTESIASRPEVRAVLGAFVRVSTYANAPSRLDAGAAVAQIRRASERGVYYVDGGWQTIVDGLERAATSAGARIHAGARAVSLARDAGAITVTLEDGTIERARSVVVATGPAAAGALLGDVTLAEGLVPAHAACLDVGLSDLPYPGRIFALGVDSPTYFSVHSATAHLAERGALVHLMKYLDPAAPPDARSAECELEGVLDLVQPGWRDRIIMRRFAPRLVATSAIADAHRPLPAVDAPRVEGVFLAGDWVASGAMLADAAIATAREAATRALAHARPRAAILDAS